MSVLEHDDLFIGGAWRRASATDRIDVVNPATEENPKPTHATEAAADTTASTAAT